MDNIIIGTAGHVDHGKTCLIKALTGVDTDRLEEEKRRGITIELGFTEMPNDKGISVGIIDVPGHDKFVRNMLAGIGGIDLVILVIGADEGVMPQTVEHFQITKLLNIKKGVIVITKMDLADEEWLELVKEDAKALVLGSFMEGAPIIPVSSYTGENIQLLKEILLSMAADIGGRKEDYELLRLPIDRVFTIEGFGTVITGTLVEGRCRIGEEVAIYPKNKIAKIRNIQVHGKMVEEAKAGQRTAINLTNIKKQEISKGNVIAYKNSLKPSMMVDVKLKVFDNCKRTLENGSRLHVYYGAAEALCKVILLDKEVLERGEEGYAQLRMEEEIALKKDDRFIVRFYSPVETIGGGIILDANPTKHKRHRENIINTLRTKELGSREDLLELAILEDSRNMVNVDNVAREIGLTRDELHEEMEKLKARDVVLEVMPEIFIHVDFLEKVRGKAVVITEKYHKSNPLSPGMKKEEFRDKFQSAIFVKDAKAIDPLINVLLKSKVLREKGNLISNFAFEIIYSKEQKNLRRAIEERYEKSGFEMPELEDIMEMAKDKAMIKQIIDGLKDDGILEKISYKYYINQKYWHKAVEIALEEIKKNGSLTLGEFRDKLDTSRKFAVIILEAFDERKITKKIDDIRIKG